MSNLRENNRHNLKMIVNEDDYWDFFIDRDPFSYYSFGNGLYDNCLISYIDVCNPNCVSGDTWLLGDNKYNWESGTSIDNTLFNISYTGLDNGLFGFRKDRIGNKDFWELYQNNSYKIEGDDLRLKLHAVSGSTQLYDYPIHAEECQIKLNGGFYQGFFETECDKYKILPNKMEDYIPWEFEFQLKKCDFEKESDKTLNDKYPDNKGIFFYIGTRAENKWVYLYRPNDDEECFELSPDEYVEDAHIDKKDYIIGNFYDPNIEEFYVDDPFNLDDYLNYRIYDEKYYLKKCDDEIIGLEEYIDLPIQPKAISCDSDLPYETIGCYCCKNEKREKKEDKPKFTGFYKGICCKSCGCSRNHNSNTTENNTIIDDNECHNYINWVNDDEYVDLSDIEDVYDYIEPEIDISDFIYETSNGLKLNEANHMKLFTTDNKFLLFNRTCTGYTINNWIDGTQMEVWGKRHRFKENLFMLMNRTCTGYTVDTIGQLKDAYENEYQYADFYGDLYNNALAFRIKDDGSIGYRILTVDCSISGDDKTAIEEGYSFPDVIKDCQWQTIHVKIIPLLETMKLYFYVDGKLVYVTKELPKLNLRELSEAYEKQEGVPYNISLGGGTQGLAEIILPNYMLNPTRVFPLEKNFAGSFIGYLKSFKFYNCGMEYGNILQNFKFENNTFSNFGK